MTTPGGTDIRFPEPEPVTSPAVQGSGSAISVSQTSLSPPDVPTEKTSNESSSTSDPYMHLVDAICDKGSEYSYEASEEDEDSYSGGEQGDAASSASPIVQQQLAAVTHPSETEVASHGKYSRTGMDRMDSALARQDPERRSGFSAWRAARRKRKEAAAAAAAAPDVPGTSMEGSPEPKLLYTAPASPITSPFDAVSQAASPLARGWQPLNSRLDSALDYMNRSTDLRISRSDLQLGMLPTIASPGRSANDADELESGAGSNRSPPSVQRVIGSETASGTDVLRTPGPSPERSAPRESFDLAFSTPPSGNPNPMAVLATLCQSAQSLVQMPFVGILLLEDNKMTSLLQFSYGSGALKAPLDAGFIESLLEPSTMDILVVEDTLQHPRLKSNAAVLEPPGLRSYAAVPLITSSKLRLGSLYIADVQPQHLDTDAVLALKNFAKAAIKRLEKMGVAAQVLERRRDLLRTLAPQQEPQLVVDTATVNWQVLQANAAAKESIGLVEEGGLLGGLWDLFAGAPQTEEEGQSASVPTGLGQKIICGKEFALRVRQLAASSAASFTLHFRPAPATAEDGSEGRSIEPIYFVDIRRGWQALQTASPTTPDGPPKRGARQYCGVICLIS